jgi:AcrR family transcriptional regulator
MGSRTRAAERREDALSRERIVAAAVELLDSSGEGGLTFRALSAHLSTGPGAIYHHVAGKDELLAAAATAVLEGAIEVTGEPRQAIRDLGLRLFDAIDAHPWSGIQLARPASQTLTLQIFEALGSRVQALGVSAGNQFDAASALLNYILGVAGQNAANARAVAPSPDRAETLGAEAARWSGLDPAAFPFAVAVAAQLRDHDDRDQFLAGLDLILAGIEAGLP